ncbi:MAG: dihydroorotase [Treponema sp.]|jgi:dihydroorotase|nr:dihydroorotase [Treponema sp.]
MDKITIFKNFHIIDEETDMFGTVIARNRVIEEIFSESPSDFGKFEADEMIDGKNWLPLMPAFADMHAHFRDPGFPEKETLESACLAAHTGGYGVVVCMANTKPVIDTIEAANALKRRADALGLIDLYPAVSLTHNMEGKALSAVLQRADSPVKTASQLPILLSEDGKDIADDVLFLSALKAAARLNITVSCHCDAGGAKAAEAKKAGLSRTVWSRIEENVAVKRAIRLGREADCRLHIAHVSTKESVEMVRHAKRDFPSFRITCEVTPHHIALTETDAEKLGDESFGRVNPPLRTEADRLALIEGIIDGTVDAIATDHAPHTSADKAEGAPGFSGLETAFAVCYTELVKKGDISLQKLSSLMSVSPCRILGLKKRGLIKDGFCADFAIVDTEAEWVVHSESFKSRGKNSAFEGKRLFSRIIKRKL